MKNLKHLFTALLLLCATAVAAHDFEVGGIYYNILSETDKTVEVTFKGTSYNEYSDEYSGSVVIPETVTVSETGTTVLKTYDAWTSTNKSNSTTSQTSYTLNVEAGNVLKFDWSVSSESGWDFLVISLDGTEILKKSGILSGSYEKTFDTSGSHTLVVKYTKDSSQSSGNDEGKIYNITLSGVGSVNDIVYRVTSIGNDAFYYCTGLTRVTIPNSVTSIGNEAFYYCTGLTNVTIPNSVTRIRDDAFLGCSNLTSVVIGNSVKSIGDGAFAGCLITNIVIPSSVTSIATNAFSTRGTTSIVVDKGNTVYDSRENCNAIIETATNRLLKGCNNTFIPNSVTIIGPAFSGCTGLTSITIPNSVTAIGSYAFSGCTGLSSIVIPNSVTFIGEEAFEDCTGLTSVTIPNSVTSIEEFAFYGCTGLISVTIGKGVTEIRNSAFDGCTKLEDVYITDLSAWCGIDITGYGYPLAGNNLYLNDELVTELIIPNGTKEIKMNTFRGCKSLTKVEIPNSVTRIGNTAFERCNGLTDVVINDGVVTIGSGTFMDCTNLTNITIPNSVTSIGFSAFSNCTRLTSITIPNSVTSIGNSAFSYCSGLTSITIPNSVTSIGNDAFYNCTSLTSVVIPNSVTSIGEGAFYNCYDLKSIEIPNSVTSIGLSAFYNCTRLTSITIPNSVTSIGERTFSSCSGLTSITIPNSVTSIGNDAFYNCTSLTSVVIPNSVTSIGEGAFYNCYDLKSIEIPNSVTSIGEWAFHNCYALKSVTSLIPADKLFEISYNTFKYSDIPCLYVPYGAKETYVATEGWKEFANIVELAPAELTITINQYGCATYCSPFALDFTQVESLKAYAATGYKSNSQVVTLTRVQTAEAGVGLFLKGEPGEYIVPVIESTDEHSLNMLVGTLEPTIVNSTDGSMSNYKFTIAEGDTAPMFYPFEDNTTFSAGKAYLQIPTAWLPATAQKSLSVRFDDGETTDIDELKGESGEVKTIYDLQGRVVENPTSGIYIIDGKKVIIK